MSDGKRGLDFVAGLLIGALAGAAAALLFAPQSGEETRVLIREKGIELRDQAETLGVQAKEKAGELQTQVKHAVEEGRAKAQGDLLAHVEPPATSEETPAQ
jgi:gas vesicle protein